MFWFCFLKIIFCEEEIKNVYCFFYLYFILMYIYVNVLNIL